MWSDNETLEDFLGYQHLVSTVESLVTNPSLLPSSVGVFGDWGSGKSSLLKMIEQKLSSKDDVIVIWFNGWLFEGIEDAKTALIGTILEKLAENKTLDQQGLSLVCKIWQGIDKIKAGMLLGKFGIAVGGGLLSAAGHAGHEGITTVAAAGAATDLATMTKEIKDACGDNVKIEDIEKCLKEAKDTGTRKSIREFRNDFEKLLASIAGAKTVVVFIDDLDRCMPETIVETLEAIKLFLFVPKTAFVIGADERLVKYAVRKRFPELPGEKTEVGRDYLEKLIQFPVRVPSLGVGEFETYINLLFAKLGDATQFNSLLKAATQLHKHELLDARLTLVSAKKALGVDSLGALEETFALASQLAPILSSGLSGNPRQCKRFLNTLLMREKMAASRNVSLNRRILAKLMLLEYFRPESFKQLAKVQAQESGKPSILLVAEKALAQKSIPSKQDGEKKTAAKIEDNDKTSEVQLPPWLDDDWIRKWLGPNPHLAGEDLRPYFFFSRDTLGALSSIAQRMTPLAEEVLTGLLHESEAANALAIKQTDNLSDAEAAGIFEALCERVKQEDDHGHEKSAFSRLQLFIKARHSMFSQFVTHLSDMPEATLPPNIVTTIIKMADEDSSKRSATKVLLEKWKSSSNSSLKTLATARANKLNW